MNVIRHRARHLRDGTLKSRGEALLPLMLATYVFDSLVLSRAQQQLGAIPRFGGRGNGDEMVRKIKLNNS